MCLEHNDPEINTDVYENGRDSKKKASELIKIRPNLPTL